MPRYDYRCSAGHTYERQEPFGSPVEQACERCGKPARRVLVAPPLIFKSGGFYKTSSRSSSNGSSAGKSDKSDSSSKKSGKSTSEQRNAADNSTPSPSTSHASPSSSDD